MPHISQEILDRFGRSDLLRSSPCFPSLPVFSPETVPASLQTIWCKPHWVDLVSLSYVELWCSTYYSLTLVSVIPSPDHNRLSSTCNPWNRAKDNTLCGIFIPLTELESYHLSLDQSTTLIYTAIVTVSLVSWTIFWFCLLANSIFAPYRYPWSAIWRTTCSWKIRGLSRNSLQVRWLHLYFLSWCLSLHRWCPSCRWSRRGSHLRRPILYHFGERGLHSSPPIWQSSRQAAC